MIKIAGCWELGWNTPILEYDLYHFIAKEYQADELIMTPVSGINKKVTEYAAIEDAIAANPALTPIFIDENGTEELTDFVHPVDALYIFGKSNYSPMLSIGEHKSIKINTPMNLGGLWAHQAMTLVLHDRFKK